MEEVLMGVPANFAIIKVEQIDAHTLGIEWSDGHKGRWRLSHLRKNCPCAECIDEWTHAQRLDRSSVPDDLTAESLSSVGRYAITISFSDGHSTGIFTFPNLRDLCQCQDCTKVS
ncbi:DUF971 domain-containing protein [Calditrichota bacterium]